MDIRGWETAVFQQHALLRDNVSVVINQLKWLKILTTGSVGAYYGSTLFPVMVRAAGLHFALLCFAFFCPSSYHAVLERGSTQTTLCAAGQ
jgi:hypothetical protein